MFLLCVQEVAELKEEDIISHTATAIQLPMATAKQLHTAAAKQTAAAGVSGDLSRTLSELHHNNKESALVIMYSLDTGDLVDVLTVIRDINNWKELGLQLGIFYPSLERIDLDQRGRITLCIMGMLYAWLKQQDNVPHN